MNEFSRLHPAVCFVYFVLLIASAVTLNHPLCVFLSLLGSASYLIITQRSRGVRFITRAVLPLALLAALFNPLFSHAGVTILAYFPSGNPFTLESVYYGFDAAGILAAMLCLFACVSHVMTEEKWICVLGRVLPSLSLVLAMAFRFVPRFTRRAKALYRVQKTLESGTNGPFRRTRLALRVFGILITKTFENALETACSMKARGYGLPGRTAFSVYRFGFRDGLVLISGLVLALITFTGRAALSFRFYPSIKPSGVTPYTVVLFISYGLFCLFPAIYEETECVRWKFCEPKI